mmetsp:Transcript_22927/g.60429  ORF Transcript_22927/g.60429 Transcript_22927/m.60429 type:complete len:152 (+) Transcript_22927:86-541(+)
MAARQQTRVVVSVLVAVSLLLLTSAAVGFVTGSVAQPVARSVQVQMQAEPSSKSSGFSIEESSGNFEIGAAAVSFFVGLLFPLLGGFTLGLIFAVLGYLVANGTAANTLAGNKDTKDYADPATQVAGVLVQAGSSGVKAVNWAAKKIEEQK